MFCSMAQPRCVLLSGCGLPSRLPAIDGKHLAGGERRFVGGQEHDGVGDLAWLPQALERYGRDEAGFSFGGTGEAVEHPGIGRPWCYRVDTNARARDLECRGSGEPLDCVLAGRIDRRSAGAVVTVSRGDIDDAAATLSLHHTQLMLHAEERAENICIEGGGVAVGRLLRHRAGLAFGARGVDRRIQPTEERDGPIDQVAYIILAAYVGTDEFGFAAERAQFADKGLACIVVATGNDDPVPFLRECKSRRAPDTS